MTLSQHSGIPGALTIKHGPPCPSRFLLPHAVLSEGIAVISVKQHDLACRACHFSRSKISPTCRPHHGGIVRVAIDLFGKRALH